MSVLSTVKVPQGILQGCTGKSLNGDIFYKFLGIPYAKPPLGDLRFKVPEPADCWTGIRDATNECEMCYSADEFSEKPNGSEDCLFLNVFTRKLPHEDTKVKPVMVWIHGGAFIRGTSTAKLYGPEFLMTEDIVLVTFQYRLGILGFLRLKDPSLEVPGNAGLKDQVKAFKWVKENIQNFNGDSENITIFGESAGATSINCHILSPMSSGLFHKAIMQSGSAVKGWDECMHDPVKIAQIIDEKINTEKDALKLFMSLPVEKLYQVQSEYIMEREIGTINKQFGPVVEYPESKTPFLLKKPLDIILSAEYNQVPIMTGYNSKEGMLFDYYRMLNPKRIMTIDSAIPYFLYLARGSHERKNLENKIKEFYFKEGDYDDNLRDLLGDVAYITATIASALNHAKTSKFPVYLYRMNLSTSINYMKNKIGLSHIPGTCHFDDVSYLLNNIKTMEILKSGTIEEKSIRTCVKLWTNFAKFGNPTPNEEEIGFVWEPFRESGRHFLNIDKELYAGINPDKERMDFWKEVFIKYDATNNFL